MRTAIHLALIAVIPGALTGCALLNQLGLEVATEKTYNTNDLNEARREGNIELLSAMCMRSVKSTASANHACDYATELFVQRGDFGTLTEICNLDGPGETYEAWFNRVEACNQARNAEGSQQIRALQAADCGELEAAFEQASSAVVGLPSRSEQNALFRDVSKKAVACGKHGWLIEEVAHWGTTSKEMGYAAIEAAADEGVQWEETFFAHVQEQGRGPLFEGATGRAFLTHYFTYLLDHGMTSRCEDYVAVADRVEDFSFGPMNWYFRETGCKAATDTIGKRLSSERHKTRQFACVSLAALGGSAYKRKVQTLARQDPYYWLREKDDQGRTYVQPIKVYDVRDACGAAATQL